MPWWNRVHGTPGVASCLQVTRSLQRYLDGEMDGVAAHRVIRHLEACRRCGLEAATYAEIKRAVARGGPATPTEAVRRLEQFAERLATRAPATGVGEPPDGDHR